MSLQLLDLFKRITWAKNGDLTDFSQTNYEAGWAHLGDDTPTVQDFNFVQQMNDKKDQWLFNQLKAVLDQAQIEPTEENINTLRDAILKLAKGYSTPNEINAESVNFIDKTGHTHEISKANTTQAGIVQLTNDLNNNREDLGLTAKAGKDLKLLINAITSNLSNYIQNSKKSDAVNSSSSDTVATSNAAKTAYDKGVEGVNLANNANENANNRAASKNIVTNLDTLADSCFFGCTDTAVGVPFDIAGSNQDLNGIHANAGYQKFQFLSIGPKDIRYRFSDDYTPTGWSAWQAIGFDDDVVSKSGDTMSGGIEFTAGTGGWTINGWKWRKIIDVSRVGDAAIGSEKGFIGFNNNGAIHFGGNAEKNQFLASLENNGVFTVKGDVESQGKKLSESLPVPWLVGIPVPYPKSSVPDGFVALAGQAISASVYPKLYALYGSRLPDLRGEFIRGWDNGRGVDSGRSLLSTQGDAIRNITGYARLFTAEGDNTSSGAINVSVRSSGRAAGSGGRGLQFDFDASRVVPTAGENRPRNIAFQYICLAG